MDRNNRIGRRERREILKKGPGEEVVAVDKGQVEPLRPNIILQALEESIARRYHEGHIWPAFLGQFWVKPANDPPRLLGQKGRSVIRPKYRDLNLF
jgi:hypothetical protein